jgi:Type II secretion system (T2SS), protein E, N-terminal domain
MVEVKKKLGDMLKDVGIIDDFQLQTALSHQRSWGGKLGAILIDLDFVKEEQLAKVISDKLQIPYVNLFEPEVPQAVIKLIKPEIAKKYQAVPAKKEGGVLLLAMLNPLDIEAMDEIRFITGLTIKPSLALKSEIKDAIRKYYDGEDVVRKQAATPFYHREHDSGGKMEVIHGSDLSMPKALTSDASSPILTREDNAQQSLDDNRLRLDALISLLIDKELITREELMSMIFHKKMGV